MQYKIKTDPRKLIGKRPNLAEENSLTDKIVSAFSVSPERAPLPPLSPLPPYSSVASGGKHSSGKVLTVIATVLLFLPFVYPVFYFVQGAANGQPLPAIMYPALALGARSLTFLGGLLLYLAARAANAFRKPIGWIALGNLVSSVIGLFFVSNWLTDYDPNMLSRSNLLWYLAFTIASLLCMIALCVFSVLILRRVFQKKLPDAAA